MSDVSSMIGVSVLMCANRDDAFLKIALDSVLCQTYQNVEIILVANGADCLRIYDRYNAYNSRLIVIKSEFQGLTTNLNIGLSHCSHPLVARMDSDDFSLPERIALQVDLFRVDPTLTVCGSCYERVSERGQSLGFTSLPLSNDCIRRMLPWKNPICHPTVMFRKAMVFEYGGYLSGIFAEDYDLWVRMASSKSVKFQNIDRPLIQYRIWPTLARGAKSAYETSAYACFSAFLRGQGIAYLGGAVLFWIKWLKVVLLKRIRAS